MNKQTKQKLACLGLIVMSIGWLLFISATSQNHENEEEMKMIKFSSQAVGD